MNDCIVRKPEYKSKVRIREDSYGIWIDVTMNGWQWGSIQCDFDTLRLINVVTGNFIKNYDEVLDVR